MAKRTKKNNTNEYGSQQSSPFAQPTLPPITPVNRRTNMPLTKQQMIEEQQRRLQLERKRKAVANRKKYYRDKASGKKKKVDPNKKYRLEKEKRIRKGKDYFYIMRKLVCFLMFLLFAASIGLFAVGYLEITPEYTALFVEPDYTPESERLDEEGEGGELIPYEDKSEYYTTVDPIFGFIKNTVGIDLGPSPKYDEMAEKAEVGYADKIASIAITYYPIAMALFIITALISMIKAFFAIFGRRIYRLFGLSSIWMIIMAVVVILGGVASNTPLDKSMDFSQVLPFITSSIIVPENVESAPQTAAGLGLLAMILLPLLTMILSMFAKKKVPFSIFD
ncbi:MAG: hypothetical protein ACOCWI_01510 [Bacillota bacterium]